MTTYIPLNVCQSRKEHLDDAKIMLSEPGEYTQAGADRNRRTLIIASYIKIQLVIIARMKTWKPSYWNRHLVVLYEDTVSNYYAN